jgi:exopolysaccharide biosynthesis WecB/TagA/CpsF family protein
MNKELRQNIFGIPVMMTGCAKLMQLIEKTVANKSQITITYANQHTLNILYNNAELIDIFKRFTVVHQDGVGIHLAAKIIYGKKALAYRLTGSDFYVYAKDYFAGKPYRLFFFGDTPENLELIQEHSPGLQIAGLQDGYSFKDEVLIESINSSGCDILFVGLGCPKQEAWVMSNKDRLKVSVIICVGDGLKIFSGNKVRGPRWAQKSGFEWFFRFLHEPARLWRRYVLGIPVFFIRVFRIKFF